MPKQEDYFELRASLGFLVRSQNEEEEEEKEVLVVVVRNFTCLVNLHKSSGILIPTQRRLSITNSEFPL